MDTTTKESAMNTLNRALEWGADSNLERVIEPLASYISATARPRAALMSALAVLISEVEQTNRVATVHLTTLLGNHLS
jgi:hypothetical protein